MLTWTDAPTAYDGFGTITIEVVSLIDSPMGKRPVRKVETPRENVEWQRSRYASGGYLSASMEELPRVQWLFLPLS